MVITVLYDFHASFAFLQIFLGQRNAFRRQPTSSSYPQSTKYWLSVFVFLAVFAEQWTLPYILSQNDFCSAEKSKICFYFCGETGLFFEKKNGTKKKQERNALQQNSMPTWMHICMQVFFSRKQLQTCLPVPRMLPALGLGKSDGKMFNPESLTTSADITCEEIISHRIFTLQGRRDSHRQ